MLDAGGGSGVGGGGAVAGGGGGVGGGVLDAGDGVDAGGNWPEFADCIADASNDGIWMPPEESVKWDLT